MFFNFKCSHSQLLYLYSCHTHYCESEDGLIEDRRRSQLRTLTEEEKGLGDPQNRKGRVQLLPSLFAHTHRRTACPRVSVQPSEPCLVHASTRKEERREGASSCISRLLPCHCALPKPLPERHPPETSRPFAEELPRSLILKLPGSALFPTEELQRYLRITSPLSPLSHLTNTFQTLWLMLWTQKRVKESQAVLRLVIRCRRQKILQKLPLELSV